MKLVVVNVVVSHLQAAKEGGLESRGGLRNVMFVVCVGGTAGPGVCDSALSNLLFCSGRTLMGGTHAWWR